ncbi:LPXTG-site transpeptidase (sortase) family protein [Streptomyces sp. SAI-126]|uniref:class F sortase n=1 Tax=Streptomyces sp. SAI-126 TaxID=3377732 RepID=UPI00247D7587|nr:LPXTG-site transpeptidase (sortase) family protein [Streptomyces sp. SAI-119]
MAVRPPTSAADPGPDRPAPTGQGSHTKLMLGAAAALVLTVVLFGGNDGSSSDAPPPSSAVPASVPASVSAAPPRQAAGQPAGRTLPRSRPVRLLIPKISVDAPFTDLAIGPTGRLEPPPGYDTNLVGWHAKGVSPGEAGTAIIAGHVDTATSAAVFVELGELRKGDLFHVDRADGRRASFRVDSVETFDKDRFPSRRVYADTDRAEVRLITCAGDYDRTAKDYTDNLVVFAHLV